MLSYVGVYDVPLQIEGRSCWNSTDASWNRPWRTTRSSTNTTV